jgi:hypothetical protein
MQKILNILGFIIGLIGLIIGLVSYLNTVKKKEISYNVFEPAYKIFDNEAIDKESNLMILTKDSLNIEQNIYLTTIAIWNSGDLTINKSDVRKRIVLKLKGVNKIIDFKLIKEVEAGISKFTYEVNKDSIYNIDWKFFDPKNGVKFQMLYLGEEKLSGKISGNILETSFVEFIPAEIKDGAITIESKPKRFLTLISLIIVGILIIIYTIFVILRKRKKEGGIGEKYLFNTVLFNTITLIVLAYFTYIFVFRITEVPF